ncbi:GLPGLI family protein [Flavobacterium branchiarum]|uniref:GLPGLI family protein n=1 Tax=Flavobacterium branchiarum TaxID=1114870 RepID=A0ABV5FL90_9FLAO|nr:GLPGLI family protein [Flavobacterium branchiarum]MDN3674886.1 GLPGLI family protein [Flavobacterium branchiarum]
MKNTFYFLLLFTNLLFAQSGIVVYSIQLNIIDDDKAKSELTGEWAELFQKSIEYARKQQFELRFNKNESSFKNIESLNSDPSFDEKTNTLAKLSYTSADDVYINLSANIELRKMHDGTLVHDSINKNWEILNESKKIGNYLCYKAILSTPYVNRYGESRISKTEAWFAPSLPYSFGPKEFCGLPGLILELVADKLTTFIATKITIEKEYLDIIFPKGKSVTKKEYKQKSQNSAGAIRLSKKRDSEK